jgi:predicted transglutaminase-like cysteine proteinase
MLSATSADQAGNPAAASIDLPVISIVERYPPYALFCRRQPAACQLDGASVIPHSATLMQELQRVSADVNREVVFALDQDIYSIEDYWALPHSGYGDCEDIALAKRARLIALDYPSAALRLAFVYIRGLSGHCILTVETTEGTFLLDSRRDAVVHWAETGYAFEARERPDGRWDRYDQSLWRFDSPAFGEH